MVSAYDCNLENDEMLSRVPTILDFQLSKDFELKNRTYTQQYANLYYIRLATLRPAVERQAKLKWRSVMESQSVIQVERTLDIKPGIVCWTIGTLYCEMPLKPNILEDVASEHGSALPPLKRDKIWSDKDRYMIEDEHGRVLLSGNILKELPIVTGVIAAVLGSENSEGAFEVKDICFPGLPPSPMSIPKEPDVPDCWMAFTSGLNFGKEDINYLEIQMMIDYLSGELGCDSDCELASSISNLFILGNLCDGPAGISIADQYLSQLALSMQITLIPGANDLTTHTLPQQPIHPSLFQATKEFSSFISRTNPLYCTVNDRCLALSGGQNLDDVFKYFPVDDRLQLASYFLKWGHMAPTAPDTLWCYPYLTVDPFVIPSPVDILAIGNQPEYATKLVEDKGSKSRVRILLVPEFNSSKSIILVNLRTLEVQTLSFQSDAFESVPT